MNYISEEQEECLKAIQKINNEMHDKEGWDDHDTLLSMCICSFYYAIVLNVNKANTEITLFSSSNDDRIFYEKSNKYEEWYSFIKRKYGEVKDILNNIKL